MQIGTPLSPSATRVMLLGAGELGKEVIIALQRLGVEVIAVDRYENAPGHQVAHRAHVISMTDGVALRELVEREKPQLIVPEIEAIATDMLVEIEAAGLAEVIPTARAARLTMNREGIRRLAAEELGLPTSPYQFADSLAELQAAIDGDDSTSGIGYPCIVKPTMSSSGKGQSLLRGPDDVQKAWDYAASGGRVNQGRVIVEGFIDFDYEITLLTVRARNSAGEVVTHFCEPIGHIQGAGDYVDNRESDILDSDDYFQYHGGMVATVRALTGAEPKAFVGDSTSPDAVRTRTLQEETNRIFRARVVNPRWISAMQRHGYKGAFELAATVDYLFGFDATAGVIPDWMYEKLAQEYVLDETNQAFMRHANPWALRGIVEKLSEAAERGLWEQPDPEVMAAMQQVYLDVEGQLED